MPFRNAAEVGLKPLPLRINLWGEPKTGKTSFAMTFPRPLHLFNFDHGFRELLLKHPEWRDEFYFADYSLPPNPTLEQGERALQAFIDDWYEAAEVEGGTMVLDQGTALKELVTFVKVSQKLEEKLRNLQRKMKDATLDDVQILRPDYAPRNQLMRAILSLPSLTDHKNVVYVWKAKEKYSGNGQATGQFEGDLFTDAPYIAQATVARKRLGFGKNVSFVTVIEDNRFDPTLNGTDFPEDVVSNYEDLRGMLV
jgi:hypothetical protein